MIPEIRLIPHWDDRDLRDLAAPEPPAWIRDVRMPDLPDVPDPMRVMGRDVLAKPAHADTADGSPNFLLNPA